MGAGYHGGFGNTYGAVAGNAVFKSPSYDYFNFVSRRKDIDANGVFDIVAHGAPNNMQVEINGRIHLFTSRDIAKIMLRNKGYNKKQQIRLLSCNTGSTTNGFAQNLANKLNAIVYAPTSLVWAYPNGKIVVAPESKSNPKHPDLSKKGKFIPFYPGGNRK